MGNAPMSTDDNQDEDSVENQEYEMPGGSDSEESEETSEEEKSGGSKESDEKSEETDEKSDDVGSEESEETDGEKSESKESTVDRADGGSDGNSDMTITAATDTASRKNAESMLDHTAPNYEYASIPKVDMKKVIIPTTEIIDIFKEHYLDQQKNDGVTYWNKTLEELNKTKSDSKKAVSYMVKNLR